MYTKNCFPGTFCTITDWTKPGTVVTSGEVNISALKQDHKPISFPACLSKPVLEVSSNEFHCLPRQSQYLFHLPIIPPSWHNWNPLLFVLPTMELRNTWRLGGVCQAFFPTTAFYSVQRSISSLLFFMLNNTVQYTLFSRPPILLTALFGHFPADLPFPWNAVPQTKGNRWGYCSSSLISAVQNGGITSCALQALFQLMYPKMTFAFFFFVTLSICIQPVICKRMQIFLWKAATWPSLLLFLAAYQFKQVVVKGCTIRRMQTSWTWGKWLLDHETESLWKGDCYSHFCCRVAALHVPMKWFCKHNNTVSFLKEGCLPVSALRDYENAHISISSGM